jgi:hypothetical protein
MDEGVSPVMTLRVAPWPFLKSTEELEPIENVFQSTMPFRVFWLMVRALPEVEILPEPAAKIPPVGREEAAWRTGWKAVRAMRAPRVAGWVMFRIAYYSL